VGPVLLANGILLVGTQFDCNLFILNHNLIVHDPGRDLAKMLFSRSEGQGLVNAELNQSVVLLILLGFLKEELSGLLVETRHSLRRKISVLSHGESTKESVDQILVLLVKELVHDEGHAGGRVLDLTHHGDDLADHNGAVNLALHLSKAFLKHLD